MNSDAPTPGPASPDDTPGMPLTPPGASAPAPPPAGAPAPGPAGASPQWVPHQQVGVIPLRPLSLGEVLDGAFKTYRQNFGTLITYSLIAFLFSGVVGYLLLKGLDVGVSTTSDGPVTAQEATVALRDFTNSIPATTFAMVISLVLSALLSGVVVFVASRAVVGQRTSIGEAWNLVKGRLVALVITSLLVGVIMLLVLVPGVMMLIGGAASVSASGGEPTTEQGAMLLGGLMLFLASMLVLFFLWPRLLFPSVICALETMGPWQSMRRGFSIVKGHYWRIFGTFLLVAMISGLIMTIVSGILSAPFMISSLTSGEQNSGDVNLGSHIVSNLVQALFTPFVTAVLALMYIDLRIRKEGLDVALQEHVDSLSRNPAQ